jgi:hypothetical protein
MSTWPAPTARGSGPRGWRPTRLLLLILPGSRPSEIGHMTPVYGETVALLRRRHPGLEVAVVVAGTVAADVTARVAAWPFRVHLVQEDEKYDAMRAATTALATSGTVSTELALAEAPMVIGYRFDPLSYAIMKPFFTGKFATLFNTAADEMIAPELIQKDATPEKLAAAVGGCWTTPEARATGRAPDGGAGPDGPGRARSVRDRGRGGAEGDRRSAPSRGDGQHLGRTGRRGHDRHPHLSRRPASGPYTVPASDRRPLAARRSVRASFSVARS